MRWDIIVRSRTKFIHKNAVTTSKEVRYELVGYSNSDTPCHRVVPFEEMYVQGSHLICKFQHLPELRWATAVSMHNAIVVIPFHSRDCH